MGIVVKQSSWNIVFILLGFALGGVTRIFLLPKYLSGEELGQLDILLSHALLLSSIFNLGASQTVVKFFEGFRQKGREKILVTSLMVIPFVATICASVLLYLFKDQYAYFINEESQPFFVKHVPIMILILLTQTNYLVLVGVSNSYLKTVAPVFFSEVFVRLLVIIALFFLATEYISYEGFLIAYSIIYALQLFFFLGSLRGVLSFQFSTLKKPERKGLLSYGLFTVLDSGATRLIALLDVLMIGKFLEARFAGYYMIGSFIATVVKIPNRAISPIATSIVAKAWHNNNLNEIQEVYKKSSLNQLILSGVISVLILSNVDDIQLLLPEEYRVIGTVIFWLSIGNLINSMSGINGSIITTSSNFRWNFYLNSVLLVITFITNVLFIPEYGITGASFATFLSLFAFNSFKFLFILIRWGIQPFSVKHIVAMGIMFCALIVVYYIPLVGLNTIITIGIRSAIAGALCLAPIYMLKISPDLNASIRKVLFKN